MTTHFSQWMSTTVRYLELSNVCGNVGSTKNSLREISRNNYRQQQYSGCPDLKNEVKLAKARKTCADASLTCTYVST